MRLPVPALLLITDRRQAAEPLAHVVGLALEAGCRWISLREKDLEPAERTALLASLAAQGRPFGATVMVHEDVEAAVAARAAGVHLPADGDVVAARRRLGAETLIGISCHSAVEVARAAQAGADYATVSPVFMTASKPGYGPALGLDGLAEIAALAKLPIIALGGIEAANAPTVIGAGAAGVAVMGGIMRVSDPRAATAKLLAALTPS
jgi:thiamine-phosphate pyrophosphorylase